jgi:hypothetical protein
LNKLVLLHPYLELKKAATTFLTWQGESFSVRQAPARIFDLWVRQFVEQIVNVDAQLWDIYDRWNIINELLKGGFLVLVEGKGGSSAQLKSKQEVGEAMGLVEALTSEMESGTSVAAGVEPVQAGGSSGALIRRIG